MTSDSYLESLRCDLIAYALVKEVEMGFGLDLLSGGLPELVSSFTESNQGICGFGMGDRIRGNNSIRARVRDGAGARDRDRGQHRVSGEATWSPRDHTSS